MPRLTQDRSSDLSLGLQQQPYLRYSQSMRKSSKMIPRNIKGNAIRKNNERIDLGIVPSSSKTQSKDTNPDPLEKLATKSAEEFQWRIIQQSKEITSGYSHTRPMAHDIKLF